MPILGAAVMLLVAAMHLLRLLITGRHNKPRQFTCATGILMLSFTLYLIC